MPRRLLTLVVALHAAACAQDLSIHVRGGDRPPNPGYLTVTSGVQVDRFQIVLRNLRLEQAPTDGGVDTPGSALVGEGPFLMDLAPASLADGVFTEVTSGAHVGAKGFYEIDIGLNPVTQGDVNVAPALAPMLGHTFVITGRNQSNVPFVFQSSVDRIWTVTEVFRMGTNHNNIDINIAPNQWFIDKTTNLPIDPLTADAAQRATIEANVVQSITAYEDDDMDGIPDPLG